MRVLVAGALANKARYGGEAWVRLAWVRGLAAVGADVFFVEEYDDEERTADGVRHDAAFFTDVCGRHGLRTASALITPRGAGLAGLVPEAALDFAADADLLVNISGNLSWAPLFGAPRRRAYVDLDPGFTQFWHADGVGDLRLDAHDTHFTVGLNVGRRACDVPTGGLDWVPVLQPYLPDEWPACAPVPGARFTTVASWRGAYGCLRREARVYGAKAHEFRTLAELPKRAPFDFEIALDIHPADDADRRLMERGGWLLTDPRERAGTPEAFRDYVQGSTAEFSVAQGVYVDTRSGWFSDRSVRYLATGRPVVVQDTGFGTRLPVGDGLLAFRGLDAAEAAVRAVVRNRRGHEAAARQIAEEFFAAAVVLPEVLDRATSARSGVTVGGPRVHAGAADAGARLPSPAAPSPSASSSDRRPCLVSGMVARVPDQGGATWATLQYVVGLRRLGHDVLLVEEVDAADLTPAGAPLETSANARVFRREMARFGLDDAGCLLLRGTDRTVGLSRADVLRRLGGDAVLLNLSGTLRDPEIRARIPTQVYLDLDPAFTQLWHAVEGEDVGLGGHSHYATVGLELGRPGCLIPSCGLDWIPTVPPVVLDHWTPGAPLRHDAMTTVANWRSYGSVTWNGVHYGQKVHAFRELFDLPGRVLDQRFDLALAIHENETEDIAALEAHRFRLVDPQRSAGTPASYRDFVRGSMAELGVAKTGYVRARCGWFSDRSACYLAAGRPVLAQETGFAAHLPTGRGLLTFRTTDEAAAGVEALRRDYATHARAAHELAREHFDAERVLRRLLDRVA